MEQLFSKYHLWILRTDNNKAKIGLSDYAQENLGNILFLDLPEVDEQIETGKKFGDIESVKMVSDLLAPVSGRVIAVNEALADEPDEINVQPYKSWLIEVEITKLPEELMTENNYKEFVNR
jgi:glycine cleavage system H protein